MTSTRTDRYLELLSNGTRVKARVPPTTNMAERALRPLVVLRKITFGHRSHVGAVRRGRLMTVAETAKRHGHCPSDIYYGLFTQPPGRVMRQLYDYRWNLR